jgi:hypothetical protein
MTPGETEQAMREFQRWLDGVSAIGLSNLAHGDADAASDAEGDA